MYQYIEYFNSIVMKKFSVKNSPQNQTVVVKIQSEQISISINKSNENSNEDSNENSNEDSNEDSKVESLQNLTGEFLKSFKKELREEILNELKDQLQKESAKDSENESQNESQNESERESEKERERELELKRERELELERKERETIPWDRFEPVFITPQESQKLIKYQNADPDEQISLFKGDAKEYARIFIKVLTNISTTESSAHLNVLSKINVLVDKKDFAKIFANSYDVLTPLLRMGYRKQNLQIVVNILEKISPYVGESCEKIIEFLMHCLKNSSKTDVHFYIDKLISILGNSEENINNFIKKYTPQDLIKIFTSFLEPHTLQLWNCFQPFIVKT
jgi:hypothetical protein